MQLLRHLHNHPRRIAARHRMIHRQAVRLVERRQEPQPLQAVRAFQVPSAPRRVQHDQVSPRYPLCVVQRAQRRRGEVRRRQHVLPAPELARLLRVVRRHGQNRARRVRQQLPRYQAQSRAPCTGNRFCPQHQQCRLVVAQRQQDPLAHDARLHARVHRDPLLLHFRFDPRQLCFRSLVVVHRRWRAFGERISHRIDHMDQQQHGVLQPRQFLRAPESR